MNYLVTRVSQPFFITDKVVDWMETNTPLQLATLRAWLLVYDAHLDDTVPTDFVQDFLTPRQYHILQCNVTTLIPDTYEYGNP